jgi:hypothetical protein
MNKFFIFDTNTLLSALFDENSIPALALKKARGQGILLTSIQVIREYRRVFFKPKFDKYISFTTRLEFIENIIFNSFRVNIIEGISECRDSNHDKWLSLAVSAEADCIVTDDKDLLVMNPFRNTPILNSNDFLKIY